MIAALFWKKMHVLILIVGIVFLSTGCRQDTGKISYNRDIRPIFNKNCLVCHGGVRQRGGFSLLFEEDAFGNTESGERAIVRGDHRESELYKRLVNPNPEKRMPQEADPLSEHEINLIARWIDEGAKWEKLWSYQVPEFPDIPDAGSDWPINPIDRFVLRKMQQNGLEPALEADKYRLIRRLSLDITGLPPTPEQVSAFISDTTVDAYEKLVDRLLASPRYGEKWASMWLDLARYANSKGYEKDPYRNIWRYRDWVISALNRDMPFDEFTIDQLAGDMLKPAGNSQLIATGFHRNTMTNTEGGTEDEEFRVAAVIDRVNTTMEVWQGVTINCVQCHHHPYDPIRHDEFYKMAAFFNNTQDADLDSDFPLAEIYSEKDAEKIRQTISHLVDLKPEISVHPEDPLSKQIRNALFPRLLADYADDYENVIMRYNGPLDNSSANLNNQKNKSYYFTYDSVELKNLTSLSLRYSAEGNDARIKTFADSAGGSLLAEKDLASTGAKWDSKDIFKNTRIRLKKTEGKHALVFEILNTTGKVPDGLVRIREIDLKYQHQGSYPENVRILEDQLIAMRKNADLNLVMKEKTVLSRETHVFERGNWLLPGKTVRPDIPESLGKFPDDQARNRLSLAMWLVSPDNPLTARVTVNRLWEQLFGRGIVETTEDFGSQGEPPSHPGLLDYLSLQFSGTYNWSIKSIIREMVLSATYRQSSGITPEKLEKDPYNVLLSRGPRFRLSAEQLRDQALAVSGLLDTTMGGKSTMPVQPEGTWQVVYNNEKWITTENDKHRRSVYTYWKRTSPYPSYITFDAPSREFCVSRRIRTNTPLQALVTLNDPVYTEVSIALAGRMSAYGKNDTGKAISYGYRLALCHEPDDASLRLLTRLFLSASNEIDKNISRIHLANNKTMQTEMTPMAIVANAIINLDEFQTRE